MSMQELSSIGESLGNWGRIAAEISGGEPNSDCSKNFDGCESVNAGDDGYSINIPELIVREPDKDKSAVVDYSGEVFLDK